MPKEEWGVKRICPTTGKRFYDLNQVPIVSPYTGEKVEMENGKSRMIAADAEDAATTKAKQAEASDDDELLVDDDDVEVDLVWSNRKDVWQSQADFFNAMRQGTSPEGKHYFPAFPYASYARMNDQDIANLWAFMATLPIACCIIPLLFDAHLKLFLLSSTSSSSLSG